MYSNCCCPASTSLDYRPLPFLSGRKHCRRSAALRTASSPDNAEPSSTVHLGSRSNQPNEPTTSARHHQSHNATASITRILLQVQPQNVLRSMASRQWPRVGELLVPEEPPAPRHACMHGITDVRVAGRNLLYEFIMHDACMDGCASTCCTDSSCSSDRAFSPLR